MNSCAGHCCTPTKGKSVSCLNMLPLDRWHKARSIYSPVCLAHFSPHLSQSFTNIYCLCETGAVSLPQVTESGPLKWSQHLLLSLPVQVVATCAGKWHIHCQLPVIFERLDSWSNRQTHFFCCCWQSGQLCGSYQLQAFSGVLKMARTLQVLHLAKGCWRWGYLEFICGIRRAWVIESVAGVFEHIWVLYGRVIRKDLG